MRLSVLATSLGALALATMVSAPGTATASKSKMGCDTASEVWNAALGKCEPGTPKYKKKSDDAAKPAKVTAAKKAPAAKKEPAAKKAPAESK